MPGKPHQLPEDKVYVDEGCDIASSCLACPLPACRYEMSPKKAGMYIRLYQMQSLPPLTAAQAAAQLGVAIRTVKRYRATMRAEREGV